MNYRHAFHAGSFADVVKHAALARILVHLRTKSAAFRVIDTHAGSGRYDLAAAEAGRTGEWRDGIARIVAARLEPAVAALLAPYLDVVARLNPGEGLAAYPGSCEIARAHLRPQDRLVACELEPNTARALARNFAGDERVSVIATDGWTALTAYVPPKERRGVVLVDPAFEQPDEFDRLADRFAAAHRKWPTGIYVLWYPIKRHREPEALARRLERLAMPKILRAEVAVAEPRDSDRLAGCGLIIVNPPWTLERELAVMFPALVALLARDTKGAVRLAWLAGEK
jgi:23S rRNA (adenine2030-N6)-methyltransferase